ncbi:hypothetical protein HMPREF3034_01295 [Prevotella sp. DNF00663]|nr:hypothetical protein HMPREF3034_01295 [Prevotella sp. DNF00663]
MFADVAYSLYDEKNFIGSYARVVLSVYKFDNFIVNMLGALAAYCLFPKKPCVNVQRTFDTQPALF